MMALRIITFVAGIGLVLGFWIEVGKYLARICISMLKK